MYASLSGKLHLEFGVWTVRFLKTFFLYGVKYVNLIRKLIKKTSHKFKTKFVDGPSSLGYTQF